MAVLEKIRVRMGVFISVIIGLALISFIVDANTLQSVMSMFSSQNDVGKINGTTISYQDFAKRQEYYTQIHSLWTGGGSLNEKAQEQVKEQAWQDFFRNYALNVQYKKCGIEVSAKELVDLSQGRYISPILQQDPVFWGEAGSFSRANVLNFIRSIDSDPSDTRAMYWQYCENQMRDAQLIEKYVSLLTQSRYANSLELKRNVADRNTTADISYITQPLTAATDSIDAITESAIRDYYKKHKRDFEQETSRDIEYVAFEVTPSDDDIRLTEETVNRIYTEFTTTPTDELGRFVSRNSDQAFTSYYYKKEELTTISEKLDSFAFQATTKDILPVFREGNTFYMARIIRARMMPDSVQARHILIQNRDKAAASKLADSLITVLNNGANFGYIAQQHSADQVANRDEGNVGWFAQDASLLKEFRDTCFITPRNKLIKIESNVGLHIIEVTDRSPESRKVQLAIVEKTAHPGKITYQNIFTEANNLASASQNQRALFMSAAAEEGYNVTPAYSVVEGQKTIGALPNARELSRWAYEAKTGDVSSVLTIDHFFVVATLTAAREAGVAPLEQVRAEIENHLQREGQANRLAQQLNTAIADATSLDAIAEKANLPVNTAIDLSFTSGFIPGIGIEPKLLGAVAGAKENAIAGPVKGERGVYVFTITKRTTGEAYTAEDEKIRERYTAAQTDFYLFYDVIQKAAGVEDHRGRFF
ncbi:MAG: SurA N-terminal domain-containing protein [Prevotellaceae bacterium]|jgi:peptidyl-prolyl cis-trans isomerase D|nr:SurA N-terminal domain-containing protein [Prevotellaceae bacterium]